MPVENAPSARPFTLTLILVRHGETEWNAANRFQGMRDVPLSDTGRAQAEALRDRFTRTTRDGEPPLWCLTSVPTTIWASDLSRAAETAEIIHPAFPNMGAIETLPLLRERSYGEWEGLTIPEIREKFGMATTPSDAEPYEDVLERNRQARNRIWESVAAESGSGVALVVGHGGTLRMMIALALGMGAEAWHRIRMDNTGVSAVSFHGDTADTSTGRVLCVNDTTHFDALKDRDPRFRNDRPRIVGPVG